MVSEESIKRKGRGRPASGGRRKVHKEQLRVSNEDHDTFIRLCNIMECNKSEMFSKLINERYEEECEKRLARIRQIQGNVSSNTDNSSSYEEYDDEYFEEDEGYNDEYFDSDYE